MIVKGRNNDGKTVYTGNIKHLQIVAQWTQALFHCVYGKEEGEKRYSQVRLTAAMDLWAKSHGDL